LRQEKIQIQIKRSGEGYISAENGLVAETAEIVTTDWPWVIVGSTPNSSGTWGRSLWLLRIHWDGDGGYPKNGWFATKRKHRKHYGNRADMFDYLL
jgi:hypothetical protein